jgi:hypothetical protein
MNGECLAINEIIQALFRAFHDNTGYYVCVGLQSGTSTTPPPTSTTPGPGTAAPVPTQEGIPANCNQFCTVGLYILYSLRYLQAFWFR